MSIAFTLRAPVHRGINWPRTIVVLAFAVVSVAFAVVSRAEQAAAEQVIAFESTVDAHAFEGALK